MHRIPLIVAALVSTGVLLWHPGSAPAQTAGTGGSAASERIAVCPILSKEEVKKHLPWIPALDQMPIDEEAVGASGSSCNYPSVHVQILPFTRNFMDMVLKQEGLERIAGIGDEAHLRHNPNGYVELFVRAGKYVLSLQADADRDLEAVRTGVRNLANAYVAKLR